MTTDPNKDALREAIRFHEVYERLAPSFGYETRAETRAFDPESPNGQLMITVMEEVAIPAIALLDEVEAVLRPFAHSCPADDYLHDGVLIALRNTNNGETYNYISIADFRRAHTLLTKLQQARSAR